MAILQAGMEKSGNYWLYKLLQSALHHSGRSTSTYIQTQPIYPLAQTWQLSYAEQAQTDVLDIEAAGLFHRIGAIYRMPVLDLEAYLAHAAHVWTHSDYCARCDAVLPRFDKIVYLVRDPRDVALSMARFQFTPYMQAHYPTTLPTPEAYFQASFRKYLLRWGRHVGGYLQHTTAQHIYVLFYERLLADTEGELRALLTYLDLTPTPALLSAIQADTAFTAMQSANPEHVQQGRAAQWVASLTPAQHAQTNALIGKLLTLLNYPLTMAEAGQQLPALPAPLDLAALAAALAPPAPTVRQRLKGWVKAVITSTQSDSA
ncbi:MAG: sulfotransferase domain-containing protein [Armatimonadetes bacterium]|nr:sulfotransferase domain-containing protein [Anaerolineae bacterium]